MDYPPRRYLTFAVFSLIVALSSCEHARDIILTPKQSTQVKGKTLYYRAVEELDKGPGVPWEHILKHLTYVTLYGVPNEQNQISDRADYKSFMNASYTRSNSIVTNFGDVIPLADGYTEKLSKNEYRFVEGRCPAKCNEKVIIAEWAVAKIRHRDSDKRYRDEVKFIIDAYHEEHGGAEARDGGESRGKRIPRQFILRDIDYPENFLWLEQHVQRRLEENQRYLERLHRFNEIFSQPVFIDSNYYTSDNPVIPQLNFGEFLREPIQRRPDPIANFNRYIPPTTYRPNYQFKFAKPPLDYEISFQKPAPIATNYLYHNNYYFSDNKFGGSKPYDPDIVTYHPRFNFRPQFGYDIPTPPPIKHQIPLPPNYAPPSIVYSQYPTAAPDNLALGPYQFATQPISANIQPFLYNLQVTNIPKTPQFTSQPSPTQPFIESPKEQNFRYSEPDPLYKNEQQVETIESVTIKTSPVEPSTYAFGSTTSSIEYEPQIKNNFEVDQRPEQNNQPEAVTLQLPAPEQNTTDDGVPVISKQQEPSVSTEAEPANVSNQEESINAVGTVTDDQLIPISNVTDPPVSYQTTKVPIRSVEILTEILPKSNLLEDSDHIIKAEPHFKSSSSSTERPVLKWKPKKPKVQIINSSSSSSSTTPVNTIADQESPKSFPAAIELSVGDGSVTVERVPDQDTIQKFYKVKPTRDSGNVGLSTQQSVATSISIKVGTSNEMPVQPMPTLLPSISVPNVEVEEARLERLRTNSSRIKFFKASGKNDKSNNIEEDRLITKSIVEHAMSVGG